MVRLPDATATSATARGPAGRGETLPAALSAATINRQVLARTVWYPVTVPYGAAPASTGPDANATLARGTPPAASTSRTRPEPGGGAVRSSCTSSARTVPARTSTPTVYAAPGCTLRVSSAETGSAERTVTT